MAVGNLQSAFTHMFSFDPCEALLRRRGGKEPAQDVRVVEPRVGLGDGRAVVVESRLEVRAVWLPN